MIPYKTDLQLKPFANEHFHHSATDVEDAENTNAVINMSSIVVHLCKPSQIVFIPIVKCPRVQMNHSPVFEQIWVRFLGAHSSSSLSTSRPGQFLAA